MIHTLIDLHPRKRLESGSKKAPSGSRRRVGKSDDIKAHAHCTKYKTKTQDPRPHLLKTADMSTSNIFYDPKGMIIATRDLLVLAPCWVVRESKKYPGRFFFYQVEEKTSAWALPPAALGLPSKGERTILPPIVESAKSNNEAKLLRPPSPRSIASLPSSFESANNNICPASLVVRGGLGQGGYAAVVKAMNTETGDMLALKKVSKCAGKSSKARDRIALELKLMTELPECPFLMRCHSAFETSTNVYFALDLVTGGDLFFHLAQAQMASPGKVCGLPEDQCRVILSEVVVALQHMHAHGFIHRDVKVENIMLDAQGHVKLVDYGLACELKGDEEQPMSPMGSLIYMAPELLSERAGGRHTDWWAVGILAYEIMNGRSPWSSLSDKRKVRKEIQTVKVMPPRRLSSAASKFICSLLEHDVSKRLGTKDDHELNNAAFFKDIDWTATAARENSPAFVPGPETTFEQDRHDAIEAYLAQPSREEEEACRRNQWSMGLEAVDRQPEYKEPAQMPGMLASTDQA